MRSLVIAGGALALSFCSTALLTTAYADSCVGSCGLSNITNGAITNANGPYRWISTNNGVNDGGALSGVTGAVGASTDGSKFTTSPFSAAAGEQLSYLFNYITSDGYNTDNSGQDFLFADYAWAQLRGADGVTVVATLLTARTQNNGPTVPGFGMPAITPGVVNTPSPVVATDPGGNGTVFSPLGNDS